MMVSNRRILWIDFGKGITIFGVVLAHVLGGIYTNHIYHNNTSIIFLKIIGESLFLTIMPVFFSLSGFFYKPPKDMNDYLKILQKKFFTLLVPYIIFSIIYVFMNRLSGSKIYTWVSLLNIYYKPISYLWFLYVLYFIFLINGFFSLINLNLNLQFLIYLILCIIIKYFNLDFPILETFSWAIFFDFGIFIKENLNIVKSKKVFYTTLLISLLNILVMFNILGLNHKYYNDVSIINMLPKLIIDLCMFSWFLNVSQTTKIFSYFCEKGKYSLIFYLVHAPLISAARSIILKFWVPNVFILVIILLCIGWFGSLAVVYLNNNSRIIYFIFNSYSVIHKTK